MSKKNLIWICFFVGSTIGGFVPALWGADVFSFSGIVGNTIGALIGIYIGYAFGI